MTRTDYGQLGDYADVFNGKTPARAEQRETGYPVLKIRDVSEDGLFHGSFGSFVDESFATKFDQKKIRAGDTLILNAAHNAEYVGSKKFLADGGVSGAIATGEWLLVRPNEDKLNARYISHWLRSKTSERLISDLVKGIHLYPKDVMRLQIPIPPLEEQKRIAAILDQAESLRRLRQRAIDRLNTLGQAIFYEMFGDPLGNPKSCLDWELEALDKSIEFMDYRGKTPLKARSGIRLITAKNVRMGYVSLEPQEFIEVESYDGWMTRGFPKKGDVLFTTEAPLGHVAQLNTSEKVVIGQRLLTLKPNLELIVPTYLEYFLMSYGFRKKMHENSTGSTVVGIKSKLLKKIKIRYPELSAQRKFESAVLESRKLHAETKSAFIELDRLFYSLQHRAFRGEL